MEGKFVPHYLTAGNVRSSLVLLIARFQVGLPGRDAVKLAVQEHKHPLEL